MAAGKSTAGVPSGLLRPWVNCGPLESTPDREAISDYSEAFLHIEFVMTPELRTRIVDEAIAGRRAVRAFLPQEIPRETIEAILAVASRAPSGTNTQPWKVYVLTGNAKQLLTQDLLAAHDDPDQTQYKAEYVYYPERWVSPYIDRRRKVGWDLYGLLGLTRDNKAGMHAQHARNYKFFDAPVGLMFSIDRILNQGSWVDYGMFLENIMIAARGRGLDTCPQVAFTPYHRIISRHLGFAENEMFVCGMSLGYADPDKIENTLVTDRDPPSAFSVFLS